MNSSTYSRWSQGPCTVTTLGNFCPIRKAQRARKDCVFERGQTTRWRSAADERRTPAERGVPDLWTYTDASPAHLSGRRRARSTERDKRKAAVWTSPGPEIRVAHKKALSGKLQVSHSQLCRLRQALTITSPLKLHALLYTVAYKRVELGVFCFFLRNELRY